MKSGLFPQSPEIESRPAVVLCANIPLRRKFVSDCNAVGITILRSPDEPEQTLSIFDQIKASMLVARQSFIEKLPESAVLQMTGVGMGRNILVVLESEQFDASSAAKMLRLGCRGVLPPQFSSKLFRRAVSSVLNGELWAPRRLLSDLVSELLKTASLKSERALTPQETRILELSAKGYPNSAIADALFISIETVRWHKRRLNRKLREGNKPRYPQTTVTPPARQAIVG